MRCRRASKGPLSDRPPSRTSGSADKGSARDCAALREHDLASLVPHTGCWSNRLMLPTAFSLRRLETHGPHGAEQIRVQPCERVRMVGRIWSTVPCSMSAGTDP